MRELNVNEIKEVNGGLLVVIPTAVKVVAWAAAIVVGTVTAHYVKEAVKNS